MDEIDPVKVHAGDLFGETLLAICYCLTPSRLQVVDHQNNLTPRMFNLRDDFGDLKNPMEHSLDNRALLQSNRRLSR